MNKKILSLFTLLDVGVFAARLRMEKILFILLALTAQSSVASQVVYHGHDLMNPFTTGNLVIAQNPPPQPTTYNVVMTSGGFYSDYGVVSTVAPGMYIMTSSTNSSVWFFNANSNVSESPLSDWGPTLAFPWGWDAM